MLCSTYIAYLVSYRNGIFVHLQSSKHVVSILIVIHAPFRDTSHHIPVYFNKSRRGWGLSLSLSLSLRELCEGNLVGGVLYWGPWWMCKGRLWRRSYFSIGAPLGNLEGGLVYRGL